MKRLIFDTSNLLWRACTANMAKNKGVEPEEAAGLAMHMSLNSFNFYFKKYKPDQVALTFEGQQNWRKDYTRSTQCVSKLLYKGNRVRDPKMEIVGELVNSFEQLVRQHSSLVCLQHPRLEGDDLLAGYAQRFTAIGDEVIGVSGDKDFKQLLKLPNFTLINPDDRKPRVCEDGAEFFMFEKCFRGDSGDNVMSAKPRVRKNKLLQAFNGDDFILSQLFNDEWKFTDPETGKETNYKVADLYEENKLLMDLEAQPEEIRKLIDETLDYALVHHGKFHMFYFSKFLGKYKLKQISDHLSSYVDLFSSTGRNSPHRAETEAWHAQKAGAPVEPKTERKNVLIF